jgi:dsRNA-specific ribonuclease
MFNLTELQAKLKYNFTNPALLESALNRDPKRIDTSKAAGGAGTSITEIIPNYEHLEFVGDRVINLYVTYRLSKLHPTWTPKELSEAYIHFTRNSDAAATHGGPFYRIAKAIDLKSHIVLKPGEALDKHGKRGKLNKAKTEEGLLSDHMEAVVGAIFLDLEGNTLKLYPILDELFNPLGLLNDDLKSVTEFGASLISSAESSAETESVAETVATKQRFFELIAAGHHEELEKAALTVDQETASQGLMIAVLNKRDNIISYLFKNHTIDSSDIEEILEDDTLSISIRASLTKHLKKLTGKVFSVFAGMAAMSIKDDDTDESSADTKLTLEETRFLALAEAGNHQSLMKENLTVAASIAIQGLRLAITHRRTNVLPYVIERYGIATSTLEDMLHIETGLAAEIKGYLERQIKKRKDLSTSIPKAPHRSTITIPGTKSPLMTTPGKAAGGAGTTLTVDEACFLRLAEIGNHQELLKKKLNVSLPVVMEGLKIAIIHHKANIVPHIIAEYDPEGTATSSILISEIKLTSETKKYLEKKIKKKPKIKAISPAMEDHKPELFEGYIIRRVIGDGNCFFHAVVDQLSDLGIMAEDGSPYTHELLRTLVLTHVHAHPDLRAFFTTSDLIDLSRLGGWVSEQAVRALADLLKLEFQILRSDGAAHPPIIRGAGVIEVPIIRLLYNGSTHYDSLKSVSTATLFFGTRGDPTVNPKELRF